VTARKNLLNDNESSYVFVIRDSLAHKQRVQVGTAHGLDVEIIEGLKPGDQLVVEGQTQIKEGTKVKLMSDRSKEAVAQATEE